MRRFHSYGPVDRELHFCVPRTDLVDQCLNQLIGHPEKGGHYFTIWAPRQTGKTWLMQQVSDRIISEYPDQYAIGMMSMQGLSFITENPDTEFLGKIPKLFLDSFSMDIAAPDTYEAWTGLFHRTKGLFQKPLILFIDEFDSLPPGVIDRLVSLFRDIYLNRKHYRIHALALIGVRAVLGLDSERGSPFNIQCCPVRFLHTKNLIT